MSRAKKALRPATRFLEIFDNISLLRSPISLYVSLLSLIFSLYGNYKTALLLNEESALSSSTTFQLKMNRLRSNDDFPPPLDSTREATLLPPLGSMRQFER